MSVTEKSFATLGAVAAASRNASGSRSAPTYHPRAYHGFTAGIEGAHVAAATGSKGAGNIMPSLKPHPLAIGRAQRQSQHAVTGIRHVRDVPKAGHAIFHVHTEDGGKHQMVMPKEHGAAIAKQVFKLSGRNTASAFAKSADVGQIVTSNLLLGLALDAIRKSHAGEGSRGGHVIGHTRTGRPIYLTDQGPHPSYRHTRTGDSLHALHAHTDMGHEHEAPLLIQYNGQHYVRSGYNSDTGSVDYHEHDPGRHLIDPETGFAQRATQFPMVGEHNRSMLFHANGIPEYAGGDLPDKIKDPVHGKLTVRSYNSDSMGTVYHKLDDHKDWPRHAFRGKNDSEWHVQKSLEMAIVAQALAATAIEALAKSCEPFSNWKHENTDGSHRSFNTYHGTYHAKPAGNGRMNVTFHHKATGHTASLGHADGDEIRKLVNHHAARTERTETFIGRHPART